MFLRISALWLAAVFACGASDTQFLNRTVKSKGVEYRYVVAIPGDWTADRAWPVLVFLHGSSLRGTDGIAPSNVWLGLIARNQPERYSAIVVIPQCRVGVDWGSPVMQEQVLAALDASTKEFHGDPRRTYLTGYSMGGYGTWVLAANYPSRFAALVVICGGINYPAPAKIADEQPYAAVAAKVAAIPTWVFHGDADATVLVSEAREMVKLLRGLRADVRYTEYKGVGHGSWVQAYGDPELPTWLFRQSK